MKKLSYPILAALPALMLACGGQDVDELIDESAALSLSSDDPDADVNTEHTLAANDLDLDEAAEEQTDAATMAEPHETIFSCDFVALKQQIKDRFDANKDGTLDRAERAELKDHLDDHPRIRLARKILLGKRRPHFGIWKRVKWAFDADNDGQLSEEERAELIAASEARCERRRANFAERFDTNADGMLSKEEIVAGIEQLRSKWREKKAAFLAQWDTNGDGTLDEAERAALKEHIRTRRDEIKTHAKELFDANGDGMLDDVELAALKAEIRRRYVEGFNSQA